MEENDWEFCKIHTKLETNNNNKMQANFGKVIYYI